MACSCKKQTTPETATLPDEYCLFCAEKHFGTAYALSLELGYRAPNRQRIIGELAASALHLADKHPALASKLRDLRHLIEAREEKKADFAALASELGNLVETENNLKVEENFVDPLTEKKLRRALLLKSALREFEDDPENLRKLRNLYSDFRGSLPEDVLAKLPAEPDDKGRIFVFSNVKGPRKLSVRRSDLLVFLNKAVPFSDYQPHRQSIVYHRTPETCYGAEVMGCVNRYVFSAGKASIPADFIDGLKKTYDWNYTIEEGKTKSMTTGYMVVKYLQKLYPDRELTLVNFGEDVKKSTYRCPWHNWEFEAKQLANINHISTEE